ncbi:hypothetical protein D1AOALGA4SA_4507 [Olavius algarvensis Delta 1 endosymbiont]|nr:hypothetical protein D1AOALGA4SA_4507 [Olavius algarvensis Delta 1 endosymbiont]
MSVGLCRGNLEGRSEQINNLSALSFPASQLPSFPASQLPSFPASQPSSRCAQIAHL